MLKPYFLRFHRWLTLAFALPLLIVLVTGLILSFEPSLTTSSMKAGTLSAEKVDGLLAQHDPGSKARGLFHRSVTGSMIIAMPNRSETIFVDLATGQKMSGERAIDAVMGASRFIHETLLLGGSWLVIASTIAMVVIAVLGILMGLPRLRNTVGGWHNGMAWFALPLVILSPLTGLAISFGITFSSLPTTPAGPSPTIAQAVKLVAAQHDLSHMIYLRTRGSRLIARINEGGEYRNYVVTSAGLSPIPRNWPRMIHEGTWSGHLSAGINVLTSIVLLGLFGTGLIIWARRRFRKRTPRVRHVAAVPAE